MDEVFKFALLSFFVWRVSKMITDEEGPFEVFVRFRDRFSQGTWFGRGLRCLWCISFWLGLFIGVWLGPFEDWKWGIIYGISLSTVAIVLDEKGLRHE